MAQNRRVIDPSSFTDPVGARELEANALRESLAYDAYGSQASFEVIVLTKPVPMATSDAAAVFSNSTELWNNNPLEGAISFKGRIVGNGFISPHASIPNPCNLSTTESPGAAIKIINLHTTFQSVTGYTGKIPNIGDTVRVTLQSGDIKFNLQSAIFTEISDANSSAAVAQTLSSQCTTLAGLFTSFDPDRDLGDISVTYADNSLEGANIPNITRGQAQPTIDMIMERIGADLGYTPLPAGKCGFPSDFPGVSDALKEKYPVTDCLTLNWYRADGRSQSTTGHPVFMATLGEILTGVDDMFEDEEDYTGSGSGGSYIGMSSGYRSIEDQIYLRMKNGGHRTYEQVMSSPTSPRCTPPTARPGLSRHNLGLAIDFGGFLGASFTHPVHVWLKSKGLRGDGTYDIKNYESEAWHWSVDGS